MIIERFLNFTARMTDAIFSSRNRARIVVGTDRKNTRTSGYGDEGANDPESASIDIVAGFDGNSSDMSFPNDKSRIYISGKTDPDDYIENEKGEKLSGVPAVVTVSDNIYLKSRNKVKILHDKYSVILNEDGTIEIEADSQIEIKASNNKIKISSSGIDLDCSQGISGKIITDNDLCVGIDPVSGGPIISNFKQPGSLVTNQRVNVK